MKNATTLELLHRGGGAGRVQEPLPDPDKYSLSVQRPALSRLAVKKWKTECRSHFFVNKYVQLNFVVCTP